MNSPKTLVNVKRRLRIRRRIDLLVIGTLLLAIIGVGIFEFSTFREMQDKVKEQATRAALFQASTIASRLSSCLLNLGMMASLFPEGAARPIPPETVTRRTIRLFIALHPSLVDLELYRPQDGASLWSTRIRFGTRPSAPDSVKKGGTPLPSNPDFLLGKSRFSPSLGMRILPISYLPSETHDNRSFGFRTHLRVQDLTSGSSSFPWSFALTDMRNGDLLFLSRENAPHGTTVLNHNVVQVSVRDYPFGVQVSWPNSLVWERWRENAGLRWTLESGRLLFLVFLGWGIRTLVRRQEDQAGELSELSKLNEAFFEGAGAIGMVIDRSGQIIRINRAAREFMEVTLEEVRGIPYFWEKFLPPESQPEIRDLFDRIDRDAIPLHHESSLVNQRGERKIFDWTNTILRDGDRPLYLVTLGFDVTDRRKLEKSLEEQNERLERLLAFDVLRGRVAEAVAKAKDEGEILVEFCRLAMEVPEIRLVWVGYPDETGTYRMLARAGEVGYLDDVVISGRADLPEGQGPAGFTWRKGIPVYNPSYTTNPTMAPWRERGRRFGIESSATLPVFRDEKIWAVLTVYLDRPEPFDSGLRLLLEAIAENLSLALNRIDLAFRERQATLLKDTLLTNTTAGIALVRYPEGVVVEVNQGFLEILGYATDDEIVGHPFQDLAFVGEDSFHKIEAAAMDALREGHVSLRDLCLRKTDKKERFVDLSGEKFMEEGHETIVWTVVDVTERHRLTRDIGRLSDFNILLAQVNQAIAEARDESALLQSICDLAIRYGKLRLAWIGQLEESGKVSVLANAGETGFLDGIEISVDPAHPYGQKAVGEVFRTGRPLFNYDTVKSYVGTPVYERALQYCLLSAAVLPVMREGKIWGFLTLFHEEPDSFDPALQEVLSELSRDVSRGLDRLDALRRERERAAIQKVLIGKTLAGIALLENRQFRFVNDRLLQMFGYEKVEDLVGHSVRMIYSDSVEYERIGFAYSLFPTRNNIEIPDVSMMKKDGTSMVVDLSIHRIQDETSVVVTFLDVTDRHAQTEKLRLLSSYNTLLARASELLSSFSDEPNLFQSLCEIVVNHGGVGLATILRPDEQEKFRVMGIAGEEKFVKESGLLPGFTGFEKSGTVSRAFRERHPVFSHDLAREFSSRTDRSPTGGLHASASLPIYRRGSVWAILAIGHKEEGVFDDPVLEGLLIELARNISNGLDRLDLLSHQKLLSNAVEAVGEGVLITDPEFRIVFVNTGFTAITGYSAEELLGRNCRLLQGPDTDPSTVEMIRTSLREGNPFHGQILNYRKDGTTFWNLLSISPIKNDAGQIVEFVGNQRDITALIDLNKRLEYESRHDRLTGLPNRRALDVELTKAFARSSRYRWPLAVGILDLDGFKPVNDRFGHEAGDRLLRLLGERVVQTLRKTDFVARLGGDEFVLVLENYSGPVELEELLERIDSVIRKPVLLDNNETVSVGVSIGVALSVPGEQQDNPDLLLRSADQALYESKLHKADRSRSWMVQGEPLPLMQNHAQELLSKGLVEVHYQPVLSNETGQVDGVEALARLRDPSGLLLLPDFFLSQFDENDLFELSKQVLERSLADLPSLLDIVPGLWLSVNVDPRSVSEGCIDCLKRMLEEAQIDSSGLFLEILEGQEFGETVVALELLQRLKGLGVRLALDDLGSAYSSLLRLKELPVDKVKLDQEFVRTLSERPRDLHFVEAIMELSHRMGLRLTVEGVETEEILDAVRMLGVDNLQGYAISRPLPLDTLMVFLREFVPEQREAPKTLFGLYALSVRLHGTQRNFLLQSPYVLDIGALGDDLQCPLRAMMGQLKIYADSEIVLLHSRYHEALENARRQAVGNRTALREEDLSESDKAMDALTEAILKEAERRKHSVEG